MKKSLKIGLIILNIIVFLWSFWGEDVLFFPEYITSSKQVLFYVLTKAVLILLLCAEYYSIISIYENRNVGGAKTSSSICLY